MVTEWFKTHDCVTCKHLGDAIKRMSGSDEVDGSILFSFVDTSSHPGFDLRHTSHWWLRRGRRGSWRVERVITIPPKSFSYESNCITGQLTSFKDGWL